jgi:hypothetical protein
MTNESTAAAPTTSGLPAAGQAVTRQFLLSALKLPVQPLDFGADLDGDGRVDNRLGSVMSALRGSGLNLQATVDQAVRDGAALVLFTLMTEQSDLTVDQHADVAIVRALGTGEADPLATPVTLSGSLAGGRFTSDSPVPGSGAITWSLELPLGPGLPAQLATQWPGIEFTIDPTGTRLVGRLTGSLADSSVLTSLVPSLAAAFTLVISTSPDSQLALSIKALFDTGGCVNPDGTTAAAGNGRIDPCELTQSPLIKSLLASDIQLRDAAGHYHPVPSGPQLDSLSLGFGFTATTPNLP